MLAGELDVRQEGLPVAPRTRICEGMALSCALVELRVVIWRRCCSVPGGMLKSTGVIEGSLMSLAEGYTKRLEGRISRYMGSRNRMNLVNKISTRE
jgi:hypothetical protein